MYGIRIGTKVFGGEKEKLNLNRLELRLWSRLELGLSILVQVIWSSV
jgi:hypothetical protein